MTKYYFIGWPECQALEVIPGFNEVSLFSDGEFGYFVECDWYDDYKRSQNT